MNPTMDQRIDDVRMREVIQVEFVRGEGTEADPVRKCWRFYSKTGELLAEHDSLKAITT